MYCDRWTSDGTKASTWFISHLTDYAQTVVMPYNIRQQSIKLYTRIDIVYDVYYKISIKMQQEKSVEEGLLHCNRPGKDSQRLESFPQ